MSHALSELSLPPGRVGWCPGVLRPMRAGDGLLARVKPRGMRLTFAQARVVAEAARQLGNGALTVTARGNLQLRGLTDAGLAPLHDLLGEAGLLDGSPEGEAVRNVVSNPLAGRDTRVTADLRREVAGLEEALAADPAFWRLPSKFSWTVDDGGRLPLDTVASDVRFVAGPDGEGLRVGLDGGRDTWAMVDATVVGTAARLADAFLTMCGQNGLQPHRMRDLVAVAGAPAVFAAAGLRPGTAPGLVPRLRRVGIDGEGASSTLEAVPAFGLLQADVLACFARAAESAGAPDLRLTPWRGLLAPLPSEAAASRLAVALEGLPLILDPADPRLTVEACVGAPACHRGTTPVPADAARLATLRLGVPLHVSGCNKGCAHPGVRPLTLVGRDGRYDLVVDGTARDAPRTTGLSVDALATMLPARSGEAS